MDLRSDTPATARARLAATHALAAAGHAWRPVQRDRVGGRRWFVTGDPQASFARFAGALDDAGLLDAHGRLAREAGLVSLGDHFDYAGDPAEVAREGLAILGWLASHPPDQAVILAGNHDLARVMEFAGVDDARFAQARAAADALSDEAFRAAFPDLPVRGLVRRDYSAFTVAQGERVRELLLGGRMVLAAVATVDGIGPVLLTHAGVTLRDLAALGAPDARDPRAIARALNRHLARAVDRVRADWRAGGRLPLDLAPLGLAGDADTEGGGLLYHRPSDRDLATAESAWAWDPARPRRFDPRELPEGLAQACGHSGHARCAKDLARWASGEASRPAVGVLRTLSRRGEDVRYELGIAPPGEGRATLFMLDGEMAKAPRYARMTAATVEVPAADPLTVRVAGADDWARARAVRLAALVDTPDAFAATIDEERSQPEGFWRGRLSNPQALTLLATDDAGVDLGTTVIAASREDPSDAWIFAVWVAPAARGRGVGDALISTAVARARADGRARVKLEVGAHNASAAALYRRHGFRPSGRRATLPPPRTHVIERELVLDLSLAAWPYPEVIAHRGGGRLAPENTLAAIAAGASHGQRMFELDVTLSADGEPLLLHDETLERTTDGRGPAGALPLAALRALDAGAWFGEAFRGERLPTLDEVAELLLARALLANLEVKPARGVEALTGARVAARAWARWSDAAVLPLLSSFSEESLRAAREVAPRLPRALLTDALSDEALDRAADLGCVAVNVSHRALDEDRIARAHARGLRVLAWTVNDPARARALLDAGADGIVTDAVDHIAPPTPL